MGNAWIGQEVRRTAGFVAGVAATGAVVKVALIPGDQARAEKRAQEEAKETAIQLRLQGR